MAMEVVRASETALHRKLGKIDGKQVCASNGPNGVECRKGKKSSLYFQAELGRTLSGLERKNG